ncbi:L-aminoadipate-semialdehyde dehydrogenase-phosphopantetheinyl transferase [Larimichthys crocea]|uniref:holo-[acyl-carrier-protein] synthase n=1 Tax=Larimichthys crocea TaxID=215358 RepID=A0A6G0IV36_LARCR|nr:L-aminoadipate-semialdehyde dehydrogenase-phosphopantetheinyl transferase [Larimichthys crocea]
MGSVRWAFRCGSWSPSRSDWLLAARCIQPEERDRIGQFVFAKDAKSAMVRSDFDPEPPAWSFNLSHQGDYAVLAAEQGLQVGVDIMKTEMPGSSTVPGFFRIMTRQFTAYEWSVIQSAGPEHQQLATFYRHWENLLDADHHVAVALGPAVKPGSANFRPSLLPPTTFTLLSFSDLIASASPLTEEDPAYWDSFKVKAEAPPRQKNTRASK